MIRLVRSTCAVLALMVSVAGRAIAQDMELPVPVGMDGDSAAHVVLAGNAAFLRGDLRTAAKDYAAALDRKPDFAVAMFNLGLVEMHESRRERGLAHMDRGIALAAAHGMAPAYVARLRALRAAFTAQPVAT